MTLQEIAKAKTAIYDTIMPDYVARKFDTVGDEVLLSMCPFLENDTRIWEWLSEPVRLRIKQLLQTAEVEALKAHAAFDGFVIPALGDILLARFDGFDRNTQISIISEHPKQELVGPGIEIYSQAGDYRTARHGGNPSSSASSLVLLPMISKCCLKPSVKTARSGMPVERPPYSKQYSTARGIYYQRPARIGRHSSTAESPITAGILMTITPTRGCNNGSPLEKN